MEYEEKNSLDRAKTQDQEPQDGLDTTLTTTKTEDIVYPSGLKLAIIIASLYLTMFLIALDRTIIATAIPRITDSFQSIDDIGWYGSIYLLTNCGFMLTYGRLYTFYDTKWVFISGIIIFEIGSAVCGAAPSSTAFIVGRAIAGLGGSGIMTGAIMIMVMTIPLHQRPLFQGLFGAVFGIASVAGPLMGGAFTDSSLTWRWCFYINLPIGGVAVAFLFFFLHLDEKDKKQIPLFQKIRQLDPIGMLFFMPAIICLLLALQWGGSIYAWSSWREIVLFTFFGVLVVGFIAVQVITRNTTATIPARIVLQRSIISGCWYVFCVGGVMMTIIYFLPLWFQAIKGASAIKSGIDLLPMILSLVVASMLCGALTQRIGYYTPFLYAGVVLMSVGSGLLTTLHTDTGHSKWIAYQILVGFGIGCSFQQSNLAAQRVLSTKDTATGTSLVFFFQLFGGTIFISVGENVFLTKFIQRMHVLLPDFDASIISHVGATQIRDHVDASQLPQVLEAYNWALTRGPLLVAVVMGCLSVFGALGMEWLSIKDKAGSKGNSKKKPNVEKVEEALEAAVDVEPVPQLEPYSVPAKKEMLASEARPESVASTLGVEKSEHSI